MRIIPCLITAFFLQGCTAILGLAGEARPLSVEREIEEAYDRAKKMKILIQRIAELETNYANLLPRLLEAQAVYAETESSEARGKWEEAIDYDALLSRALIDAWMDLHWLRIDAEKSRESLAESYSLQDEELQKDEAKVHKTLVQNSHQHVEGRRKHTESVHPQKTQKKKK